MNMNRNRKGFTLVELLATIAIMAVLIVAALPYVADYTTWARATSQARDAQVVQGAIARWIAIGGGTTTTVGGSPTGPWTNASVLDYPAPGSGANPAWTAGSGPARIIRALIRGWTVVPGGARDPFLAPNTSHTLMGQRIKIRFTSTRDYTVTARSK